MVAIMSGMPSWLWWLLSLLLYAYKERSDIDMQEEVHSIYREIANSAPRGEDIIRRLEVRT